MHWNCLIIFIKKEKKKNYNCHEFKLVLHLVSKMVYNISMLESTIWWCKIIGFIKKFKIFSIKFYSNVL